MVNNPQATGNASCPSQSSCARGLCMNPRDLGNDTFIVHQGCEDPSGLPPLHACRTAAPDVGRRCGTFSKANNHYCVCSTTILSVGVDHLDILSTPTAINSANALTATTSRLLSHLEVARRQEPHAAADDLHRITAAAPPPIAPWDPCIPPNTDATVDPCDPISPPPSL